MTRAADGTGVPTRSTASALREARRRLEASPVLEHYARQESIEARELLADAVGAAPDALPTSITAEQAAAFDALLERRCAGESIALIRGWEEFLGLRLLVPHGVFVPRSSSWILVQTSVRLLGRRRSPVAVDVATGSGAIALAIAREAPRASVFGVDISDDAVRTARRNAKHLGLQARFLRGDGLSPLPRSLASDVDVISMHPPYVPPGELEDLPLEFRIWEPRHTHTDGSVDGMGLVRQVADAAPRWLRPGGWLAIEVTSDVTRGVATIMRRAGLREVRIVSERGSETRVVVGQRSRTAP